MSQKNILFEDSFRIEEIDKEGKAFDKVSRIEGTGEDSNCKITLDINTDVYPVSKLKYYSFLIVKSLNTDGTPSPNNFTYDLYTKKNSLIDKYDYVTYGKIFKFSEDSTGGKVSIFASFGGLLLCINGSPTLLSNLVMDERIYLLLKKLD
jgi:DNA-directed RNA polymerase I, II, and III subunit RPABC3